MNNELNFSPNIADFVGLRSSGKLTILSGSNNSGKSTVLKAIKQQLGRVAYLVGPVRFYHLSQIPTQEKIQNEVDQLESQFMNTYSQRNINHEQNFLDLGRVLANLNDTDREKLFSVCSDLIGVGFSLKKTDPANELSMRYVDVDGQNLGLASTGTRLLMTMLGICLDRRFNTVLIDEPEMGLSPKVQEAFADFLQNRLNRSEMFPHLSHVYLATHSHLFLDRSAPENNFTVTKKDNNITISQITTISELHRLQFNMLGNSLEKVSLPSAIIVVEGKTDFEYIKRLIELKFPNNRITVVSGQGDIKKKVYSIRETLGGDLQKSPYKNRLFTVVDSVHPSGLKDELEQLGIPSANFVAWGKNGIEYLYPEDVLADIYSVPAAVLATELTITGDNISVRDNSYKKNELCEKVISKLTVDTILPGELTEKLLDPIASEIN